VLSGRFSGWGTFPDSGVISNIYHDGNGTLAEIEAELLKKVGAPPAVSVIIQFCGGVRRVLKNDPAPAPSRKLTLGGTECTFAYLPPKSAKPTNRTKR
jgi:hypothetical protein